MKRVSSIQIMLSKSQAAGVQQHDSRNNNNLIFSNAPDFCKNAVYFGFFLFTNSVFFKNSALHYFCLGNFGGLNEKRK